MYEKKELNYASILSKLNTPETMQHIILPAIHDLTDKDAKIALLSKYKDDEKQQTVLNINGSYLSERQEDDFVNNFSNENTNISRGTIMSLYELTYQQCDKYVLEQRGISLSELVNIWKHCLQKHMDSNNECTFNLFKCNRNHCNDCKTKLNQCNNNCAPKSRTRERFHAVNVDTVLSMDNIESFNDHVKHQRRMDECFQSELDSIHTELLHKDHYQHKPKSKQNVQRMSHLIKKTQDDNRISTLMPKAIEMTELIKDIDVFDDKAESEYKKKKYGSTITSYKFGEDHRYEYLGPLPGHTCFKHNLVIENGFVSQELWSKILTKSFSKLSAHTIQSKQYRADYCINRGDKMSVPHMMAVCFYTDVSPLCTDYRGTFRNLDDDASENVNQIRTRHSKYYFFSRFLYEAVEFFGSIMENG
eukprot:291634_1